MNTKELKRMIDTASRINAARLSLTEEQATELAEILVGDGIQYSDKATTPEQAVELRLTVKEIILGSH